MSDALRPIDKKRTVQAGAMMSGDLAYEDMWFIHTVLAQCFLPYRDQEERTWFRKDGDFSILLEAGSVEDCREKNGYKKLGLPFGAKPRLFQSYICTQAIRQKSPVIPVEHSMTGMLRELGFEARGGKRGTIQSFKDQITRFAASHFTLIGPGPKGTRTHIKSPPVKRMDVWFPSDPRQKTLWPSEIVLSDDFYFSLRDHAIPYDFRGLRNIQNKPRTMDIYLWMTQRLCRIGEKPLLLCWPELYQTFGGNSATLKVFKQKFPERFDCGLCSLSNGPNRGTRQGLSVQTIIAPCP